MEGASNYALSTEGHIHNLKTGKPVISEVAGITLLVLRHLATTESTAARSPTTP